MLKQLTYLLFMMGLLVVGTVFSMANADGASYFACADCDQPSLNLDGDDDDEEEYDDEED